MVHTWPSATETRKALVVGADTKAATTAARVRLRGWAEKRLRTYSGVYGELAVAVAVLICRRPSSRCAAELPAAAIAAAAARVHSSTNDIQ